MHRMYTDMSVSDEHNVKFSEYLREAPQNNDLEINFYASVLQAGSWPMQNVAVSPFIAPPQLAKCMHTFETFYRVSTRKLRRQEARE